MAAGIEVEGDSLRADRPTMLFEGDFVQLDTPSYDASRDGRQFILLQAQETDAGERDRGHLMFVFNFFEELRRLAPADKN